MWIKKSGSKTEGYKNVGVKKKVEVKKVGVKNKFGLKKKGGKKKKQSIYQHF